MARDPARLPTLLAELKRRKVFRVAAVYGGAAFVVIQVADIVFPRLSLPDWTVTLVVVLALVGLVPALALAWAFDATGEGLRRAEPAAAGEIAAILAQPRMRRWLAGLTALTGLLLLGGGAGWAVGFFDGRGGEYDSIAVLPFANLSGDPADDFFGDGLAEELLNALSAIDGLRVVARTSAFALKGSGLDVRALGDTLRAAAVLEGSVRRSPDRIRISVRLVDARTGYRLWADSYDRPATDLFTVQDAIAAEIVRALAVQLSGATTADALHRGGTRDVEAYDLYLRGRQKWATREIPQVREAIRHFEDAIAHDSAFALAWSGLADAIDALAWRVPEERNRVAEAQRAAQLALSLEPLLAEGWASLGVLASDFDRDWLIAERALRRSLQLKPSYAEAYVWLGDVYRLSGRPVPALEAYRTAMELSPLARTPQWTYARALVEVGRHAEAREVYLRLRQGGWEAGSPGSFAAQELVLFARWFGFTESETSGYAREWAVAAGYALPEEAEIIGRAVFREDLRIEAVRTLVRMEAAGIVVTRLFAAIGEYDAVLDRLERELPPTAEMDAAYQPLRDHPRFRRLFDAPTIDSGAQVRP